MIKSFYKKSDIYFLRASYKKVHIIDSKLQICKCLCAVFDKRGIRELPNKSASHFLSGDFVLQNAYLANT